MQSQLVRIMMPDGTMAWVNAQQLSNITMPMQMPMQMTVQMPVQMPMQNVSVAQTTPRLFNDLPPMKETGFSETAKPIAKQTQEPVVKQTQEPVVKPAERVVSKKTNVHPICAISRPEKEDCRCDICGRAYRNASSLNQHKLKKHTTAKKKTYVNDIRGVGFVVPKFSVPDASPQKTVEDDKPMDADLADDDDTSSTTSDSLDSFDMSESSDVYSTDNFPELQKSGEKKEVLLNTSKLMHVPTYFSKKTLRVRAGFGKGEVDHKRIIEKNGKEVTESIYKDEVIDGNFDPVRVNKGDLVPVLSVGLTYLSCDEVAEWWLTVMPEALHPLVQKIKVKNVDGSQMIEEGLDQDIEKFFRWLFRPASVKDLKEAGITEDIAVCPRYTEEYVEKIRLQIKLIQRRAQVCLTLKDGTSVVGWVSLKKGKATTMKKIVDKTCKPSVRMELTYTWISDSMDVLGKKTWVKAFEQRVMDQLKSEPFELNPTKVSFPKKFMNNFYKPSFRWCIVEFDNETDALELMDASQADGFLGYRWSDLYLKTNRSEVSVPLTTQNPRWTEAIRN